MLRGLSASLDITISRPKGVIVATPSLIAWVPKGIPTIVKKVSNPPKIYPIPEMNPPNINQIKFPRKLIRSLLIVKLNVFCKNMLVHYLNCIRETIFM